MIYIKNKSILWMVAERIVSQCVQIVFFIVAARVLTLTEFGDMNLLIALSATILAIVGFNVDTLIWRIARSQSNISYADIFNQYFLIKILFSLPTMILSFVILKFFGNLGFQLSFSVAFITARVFFNSFNAVDAYFVFIGKGYYPAKYKLVLSVVLSFAKVGCLLICDEPLNFVMILIILEYFLVAGILFKLRSKIVISSRNASNLMRDLRKIFKSSWPLIVSSALMVLYLRIDQIMIYKMLGSESLGIYSALVRITESWYFILFIVANNQYPRLALLYETNLSIYVHNIKNMLATFFVMVGLFWIILFFFGDSLISFILGEGFTVGTDALLILSLGGFAVSFGLYSGKWLVTCGLQRFSVLHALTGAVLNIVLNLLLIPLFGMKGAALATVSSQLWSSTLVYLLFSNTRKVFDIFDIKIGNFKK